MEILGLELLYIRETRNWSIPVQDQTILHGKFIFTVVILEKNYQLFFLGGLRDLCTLDVARRLESVKKHLPAARVFYVFRKSCNILRAWITLSSKENHLLCLYYQLDTKKMTVDASCHELVIIIFVLLRVQTISDLLEQRVKGVLASSTFLLAVQIHLVDKLRFLCVRQSFDQLIKKFKFYHLEILFYSIPDYAT
jgi:hypothetical protein